MTTLVDQYGRAVEKRILQTTLAQQPGPVDLSGKRGYTVYSPSQLTQITGRDKEGRLLSWGFEQPYFYLSVRDREEIFRMSSPVLGVVTSRMNRLAGMDYTITTEKRDEDRLASFMKDSNSLYTELKTSVEMEHLMTKARLVNQLTYYLPDLLPDMSNFSGAMMRWKRRIRQTDNDLSLEAYDWLKEPNAGVKWQDFVKKFVFDMMIHGAAAIYKSVEDRKLTDFDTLPGGTVYKIKAPYFNGTNGYVQVVPGYMEPGIYFGDEMAYAEYIPTSSRNHSMIPLEALINKVAEGLLFDELMANQADGTKLPEKVIIVTENNPFGSLDDSGSIPLNSDEQQRLEEKVNQPVKGSIMSFSGNKAEILDLSRENTMETQMHRQKDIREEVALVFNMSNMEINLTGSGDTAGRSTSVSQSEIEQGKGIAPQARSLEVMLTQDILPFRYGPGLIFELKKAINETAEKELDLKKLETTELTPNELREKYNKDGFGPEYDKPKDMSAPAAQPMNGGGGFGA